MVKPLNSGEGCFIVTLNNIMLLRVDKVLVSNKALLLLSMSCIITEMFIIY